MARAIASGIRQPFAVTDSGSGRATEIAADLGGTALSNNAELAASCDAIFLCHKPAALETVARELSDYAGTIISVLAATPVESLKGQYPHAKVVRVMPNTPVELGEGVVIVSQASDTAEHLPSAVEQLLESLGTIEFVPEEQMELATAIGGCAPAFYALFAQRLAESAVARGMDPQQALTIAGGTLTGTGALAMARGYDLPAVQREVASPGGLTERALQSFDENGLSELIDRAVDAVLGKGDQ